MTMVSFDIHVRHWAFALILIWMLAEPALGSGSVRGDAVTHLSPNGLEERCVMLARMPGATYRSRDTAEERSFCAIDLHHSAHAMCPKLFSTSPGTLIYELTTGPYAGNPAGFERDVCPRGQISVKEAADEPMSFKISVNTRETSATFANSSLAYYHLSRYFDSAVHVPPAVFRSIDKDAHLARVTRHGESISAGKPSLRMNHAAWIVLARAESQTGTYKPSDELFTADRKQIYGVILHPRGRRYGEEINGSRKSGWGDGQNRDFQLTPPFIALATNLPLHQAIAEGLARGYKREAVPSGTHEEQMIFWMRELVDITLLDYIFSQQDRIGNIDYSTYWYWVDHEQKVQRMPAHGVHPPEEIARHAPKLIKRTELADNDAGVRTSYTNFTKRTGMLEKLRHYAPVTYRRLIALDKDFAAHGPLRDYVRTTFGFSDSEFAQIESNVRSAAEIVRTSCRSGRLRFDLDPDELLRSGKVTEVTLDCDNP